MKVVDLFLCIESLSMHYAVNIVTGEKNELLYVQIRDLLMNTVVEKPNISKVYFGKKVTRKFEV